MGYDSFAYGTRLIRVCDMTNSYVFVCATWLIHMYLQETQEERQKRRLIHIWDMTHSYMGHDSSIYGTWPIPMCDMTHSYVPSRDARREAEAMTGNTFIGSHTDKSRACVCKGINESCHTYEWVMSHIWRRHIYRATHWHVARLCVPMSHVIHMNESCPIYEWVVSYMNDTHL